VITAGERLVFLVQIDVNQPPSPIGNPTVRKIEGEALFLSAGLIPVAEDQVDGEVFILRAGTIPRIQWPTLRSSRL